ncbi:TetR/AcrR family transcriptional regulator [Bradyrhizobium erythrophlei]|uniref:TetR/AcrR family transcriptional regulator n=1 Tax=Bradyrhizobium erythrophlei TaxID=1437360 RepID=UPI0035E46991
MVQKSKRPPSAAKIEAPVAPKRRGRPRAYQPDVALGKALELFRRDGFAATSLDDLSAATGMNRPSLYGAFGDKRELYIKSYQRYRDDARAAMVDIFRSEAPLRQRLARIYAIALDIYTEGESPRGCFTVMTAASEAVSDPAIRAMVLEGFTELDKAFATCFRLAKERGELADSADPTTLAHLASATIHTIAIRARAQVPRKELEAIVKGAIDVMCASAAPLA